MFNVMQFFDTYTCSVLLFSHYVAQKLGSSPKKIRKFCISKMNNIVKCAPKGEK